MKTYERVGSLGRGDRQKIRIVAVKGVDKRKLFWLAAGGDDLYDGVAELDFHYSRHQSGSFHLTRDKQGSQQLSVCILTWQWPRPRISPPNEGLKELLGHVEFCALAEEWEDYARFPSNKSLERVLEINCNGVEHLRLKVWMADIHNVGSLRLVEDEDPENRGYARLCSEIIATGREWVLLIEAYDVTRPLPPVDAGLLGMNRMEADNARLLGKIRFREYLAVHNRELGLTS